MIPCTVFRSIFKTITHHYWLFVDNNSCYPYASVYVYVYARFRFVCSVRPSSFVLVLTDVNVVCTDCSMFELEKFSTRITGFGTQVTYGEDTAIDPAITYFVITLARVDIFAFRFSSGF